MIYTTKEAKPMRRFALMSVVLALAAAACLCTGPSVAPTLQPIDNNPVNPTAVPNTSPDATPVGGDTTPDNQNDSLSTQQIEEISKASVQIIAAQEGSGGLEPMWSGSGTIISPDGQILTNCHVACGAPVLIISLTTSPDIPPEPTYIAEITHYNEDLDLALLRLTSDIDGNPVSSPNLPYLEVGNSDDLHLGDRIYIFGYPGVGGETITFTTGSVAGFESADLGDGQQHRVNIKTDAGIASGNSGGTAVDLSGRLVAVPTAVNPDVREGLTLGSIGVLRPVNLVQIVQQQAGAPPADSVAVAPGDDPDTNEPNDDVNQATPLQVGQPVQAYISWEEDFDVYVFSMNTAENLTVTLEGPSGTDYDVVLADADGNIVGEGKTDSSSELIQYSPLSAGTFYVAVGAYSGATPSAPYTIQVDCASCSSAGGTGGGGSTAGGITITGQVVDGATGGALPGGSFGILQAGLTCNDFFGSRDLDLSMVLVADVTNSQGFFTLNGVPRGEFYTVFFVLEGIDPICEDSWLEVPSDAVDSDLGVIEITN
jgi:S1-C subfamily serine protease